jgi:hypothetical protein
MRLHNSQSEISPDGSAQPHLVAWGTSRAALSSLGRVARIGSTLRSTSIDPRPAFRNACRRSRRRDRRSQLALSRGQSETDCTQCGHDQHREYEVSSKHATPILLKRKGRQKSFFSGGWGKDRWLRLAYSSCSLSQDHLEFGAPVGHFVQYPLGFGEVEGDADAGDSPSGR